MRRSDLWRRATVVAPRLLGAVVTSTVDGETVAVRLTEVEAYEGTEDAASHAYRGPSPRNGVMFGEPGHLYVYFVYGMHWCANVVCGPAGSASAVLLRAGEVVAGVDLARSRRAAARTDVELARGPARLAACLGLTRDDDGADLFAEPPGRLTLTGRTGRRGPVERGPRVGVAAAVDVPARFWLAGEPSVSTYRRGGRRRAPAQPVRRDRQNGRP